MATFASVPVGYIRVIPIAVCIVADRLKISRVVISPVLLVARSSLSKTYIIKKTKSIEKL